MSNIDDMLNLAENKPRSAPIRKIIIEGQSMISVEDLLMALQSDLGFVQSEMAQKYINDLCKRLETIL